MKKFISVLVSLVMTFSAVNCVYAAGSDEEYKDVLLKVKELFDIRDYDEFSYNIDKSFDKEKYEFNWQNNDEDNDKFSHSDSLYIETDKDINIYSYRTYTYSENTEGNLKLSANEGIKIADDFLKNCNKNYSYYRLNESDISYYNDYIEFRYNAFVNGHKVLDGDAVIDVDTGTGKVNSYSCNIPDYNFNIPDEKSVSMDKIKEGFFSGNNVELKYREFYEDEKIVARPYYTISNIFIDAATGNLYNRENFEYELTADAAYGGSDEVSARAKSLSEIEIKEIEKLGQAVSVDDGLNIVKDRFNINIDKSSNYFNYRYNKTDEGYELLISYDNGYVNISAKGVITNFYCYNMKDQIKGYDNIKALVNKIYPNADIPENIKVKNIYDDDYSYKFNDKHNNILDDTSYISISFDENYNVNNMVYKCFQGEYIEIQKELTHDDIIKLATDKLGFDLVYIVEDSGLKLVYAFNDYFTIDAVNGNVLNKYCREFDNRFKNYIDVAGTWYEDIANTLINHGFSFDESQFKGDSIVTGKDVIRFFGQRSVEVYLKNEYKNSEYIEYAENPNKNVTRYQMADIVVNMIGYGKLAENAEFVKPFDDVDNINTNNVAICKALDIVNGEDGKFNGDEPITRAEMAAMVYRAVIKNGLSCYY